VTHRPYHIYLYIYNRGLKGKIENARERSERALSQLLYSMNYVNLYFGRLQIKS
jgi:hypothetical protein